MIVLLFSQPLLIFQSSEEAIFLHSWHISLTFIFLILGLVFVVERQHLTKKICTATRYLITTWCINLLGDSIRCPARERAEHVELKCGVCGCYVMLSPHNNRPIIIKTAFGIPFPHLFWKHCCLLFNRFCCSYCICDSNWAKFYMMCFFYSRTPYTARMQFN